MLRRRASGADHEMRSKANDWLDILRGAVEFRPPLKAARRVQPFHRTIFAHQEVRFSVRLVHQTSCSDLDRVRISIGHDVALRSPLGLLGDASALKKHRSTSLIFHVCNRQDSASPSPSNLTHTSTALNTLSLGEAPDSSMAKWSM